MPLTPVTIWSTATHSCVLRRSAGLFELLLYQNGRATRLHTCETEHAAYALAYEWQLALAETLET